jgi:hypothetical protein
MRKIKEGLRLRFELGLGSGPLPVLSAKARFTRVLFGSLFPICSRFVR